MRLIFLVFTLGLFFVMVKLGFWQLSRGEQKQQWQQTLNQRIKQNPLDLYQLNQLVLDYQNKNSVEKNLTGYPFEFQASPIQGRLFMLDNQIYQGKVGYLVFQPVMLAEGYPLALLELGFVAGSYDRSKLPTVKQAYQKQVFTGRIYQKQPNPLSDELHDEAGWPKRIQNINISAMEAILGYQLYPLVLQPNNLNNSLPHPWHPIPLPAKKHFAYSLQWFSLAIALAVLTMFYIYRTLRIKPLQISNKDDK